MTEKIAQTLPSFVTDICTVLTAAGHRAYLVGGSLRDLLSGKTPHDYDLTTDATPDEMCEIFKGFRVIPTGLKHGTLTVLSEGHPVEITTHRTDGMYLDSRRPESVSFTRELREDLSRRDFTVNAMAWSAETGLVDLFGGKKDLNADVLRAVGDPEKRFGEDALRILRLFRFSAQLNFSIDPATQDGAYAMRAGLSHISAERILSELVKLLESPAVARGLAAMREADCLPFVFGDIAPDLGMCEKLATLAPRAAVRLAALCHLETPERARKLCRDLHASNAFCDTVTGLLRALGDSLPTTPYEARRFAVHHFSCLNDALELAAACGMRTTDAATLVRQVVRDKTAVEPRRLAVNGRELQETVGVAPAETATMLAYLLDLVWQEPANNRRATLLAAAKEKKEADR